MKTLNSFSIIVDSPNQRQSLQLFYVLSCAFFLIGSLAELVVAILLYPSISWIGFLPLMLCSSLIFLTLSVLIFFYSQRYFVLDKDKVRIFTGFKKKEFVITKEHALMLETKGNNVYNSQHLILISKGHGLVFKYPISFAANDSNATERVTQQMNAFAQITQCSVQCKWES